MIVLSWLRAANSLNSQFIKLEEEKEENADSYDHDESKNCVEENNVQKSSESLAISDEAICATQLAVWLKWASF